MKNFTDYAEAAIKRYGLSGYNNLAREIQITKASMSRLRSGQSNPSEETMIKLAELAGLPKEEALIDLNLWRSKNNPELNKIWQRLSKMVGCLVAASILSNYAFSKSYNHNLTENLDSSRPINIYYAYFDRFLRFFNQLFSNIFYKKVDILSGSFI